MKSQERKMVYVAMSGGVDSSVAAALLKKQGYDVTGVFMKPWQPEISKYRNIEISSGCLWQKDREDAMRVATKLGIPLLTWDFSKEYKREVADYMIREYRAGRTPNPDVMCNKHIKFGLFLEKALKEGADYIATGHYVRLMRKTLNSTEIPGLKRREPYLSKLETLNKLKTKNSKKTENLNIENSLKIAKDKNKDQSYFLWTLTQKQLKYCLFPIGDYIKPEVRRMAKKFGLPTADKKDSQGVCFVGPLDIKVFLKSYIKPKTGDIILVDNTRSTRFARSGRVIGQHDGVFYYTLGQRHGLDIKNGRGPHFIIKKDIKKNILFVGSKEDLFSQKMKLTSINWINRPSQPVDNRLRKSIIHRGGGLEVDVRVRYRAPLVKAIIHNNGEVVFKKPEIAITPGQSAVFYKHDELIGGGIIK